MTELISVSFCAAAAQNDTEISTSNTQEPSGNRQYLAVWGSARDCPRLSDRVAGRPRRVPRTSSWR